MLQPLYSQGLGGAQRGAGASGGPARRIHAVPVAKAPPAFHAPRPLWDPKGSLGN